MAEFKREYLRLETWDEKNLTFIDYSIASDYTISLDIYTLKKSKFITSSKNFNIETGNILRVVDETNKLIYIGIVTLIEKNKDDDIINITTDEIKNIFNLNVEVENINLKNVGTFITEIINKNFINSNDNLFNKNYFLINNDVNILGTLNFDGKTSINFIELLKNIYDTFDIYLTFSFLVDTINGSKIEVNITDISNNITLKDNVEDIKNLKIIENNKQLVNRLNFKRAISPIAYFNGESSEVFSEDVEPNIDVNTVYFEVKCFDTGGKIYPFINFNYNTNDFISCGLYSNNAVYIYFNNNYIVFTNPINDNEIIKVVIRKENNSYYFYVNGDLYLEYPNLNFNIENLSMGYGKLKTGTDKFAKFELFDIRISTKLITEIQAINITRKDINNKIWVNEILNNTNSEIIYNNFKDEVESWENKGFLTDGYKLSLVDIIIKQENILDDYNYYLLINNEITRNSNDNLRIMPVLNAIEYFSYDDFIENEKEKLKGNIYNHQITFNLKVDSKIISFLTDFKLYDKFTLYFENKEYKSLLTGYSLNLANNVVKLTYGKVRIDLTDKINKLIGGNNNGS